MTEQSKWKILKDRNIITAGFDRKPADRGDKLLNKFIDQDRIVAYSSRNGAVGYGVIEKPNNKKIYSLTDEGDGLGELHRLKIKWMAVADSLDQGIRSREVKEKFDIHHPVQTSSAINNADGVKLIAAIEKKFKSD